MDVSQQLINHGCIPATYQSINMDVSKNLINQSINQSIWMYRIKQSINMDVSQQVFHKLLDENGYFPETIRIIH